MEDLRELGREPRRVGFHVGGGLLVGGEARRSMERNAGRRQAAADKAFACALRGGAADLHHLEHASTLS